MGDKLVEINKKDLQHLLNLYKTSDNSRSEVGRITIDSYIRWHKQDPNLDDLKIFCLNGDFSSGTFVAIDCNIVYADTLNESNDELIRLLVLLNYSKEYLFMAFDERIASIIREAVKIKNVKLTLDYSNLHYFLPKEKALEFEINHLEGIELKPLTKQADIEKIYSSWPMADRNSLQVLLRAANYNSSVGAFADDGTLMAWIFRRPTGLLFSLQTDENHRGRGYASVVLKALAKQVAEQGDDSYGAVSDDNIASRTLFERRGFEVIGKVFFLRTAAK